MELEEYWARLAGTDWTPFWLSCILYAAVWGLAQVFYWARGWKGYVKCVLQNTRCPEPCV